MDIYQTIFIVLQTSYDVFQQQQKYGAGLFLGLRFFSSHLKISPVLLPAPLDLFSVLREATRGFAASFCAPPRSELNPDFFQNLRKMAIFTISEILTVAARHIGTISRRIVKIFSRRARKILACRFRWPKSCPRSRLWAALETRGQIFLGLLGIDLVFNCFFGNFSSGPRRAALNRDFSFFVFGSRGAPRKMSRFSTGLGLENYFSRLFRLAKTAENCVSRPGSAA